MIKSMTGFSNKRLETDSFLATAEVKSLNSKFLDLSIRLPKSLAEKELDIRNNASSKLVRGKVSISLEVELKDVTESRVFYNAQLFKSYYQELKKLSDDVGANDSDLFKIALQSPEVMRTEEDSEGLQLIWESLSSLLDDSIQECDDFRVQEGENLQKQLEESLQIIARCMSSIKDLDPTRIQRIREKINNQLEELVGKDKIDENRFEQELIYFIEKLDISEEFVRLESHLKYFDEVLKQDVSNGKKLGFISQELGREINTIGSKANDADIQKLVVQMKDELEKIKEQILNVL